MTIKTNSKIEGIPSHFQREIELLDSLNISTWDALKNLTDQQIENIISQSFYSKNNLKKLRSIALLVSGLNIPQHEASILIHSGYSSISSLARCSPQDLIKRTGRLERQLNTTRKTLFNIQKATHLISLAKHWQKQN